MVDTQNSAHPSFHIPNDPALLSRDPRPGGGLVLPLRLSDPSNGHLLDPGLEDGSSRFDPDLQKERMERRLSRIRAELLRPFPDLLPRDLPIRSSLPLILDSVRNFPFTIVTSPTGSGKTIGIPHYLLTNHYGAVVTQPRIIAARGAAGFLAQCIDEEVGNRIGYRTAKERCDSASTVCQFVTDGLEVMRVLRHPTRMSLGNRWVLMVDEFHERNLNHDTLLAYFRTLHRQGDLKVPVIISSATLDTEALSQHLGPKNCNVINCDGRMFPIENMSPGRDPVEDGVALAARGEPGILHFVAGKREIYERMDRYERTLEAMGVDAVVMALHSELSAEQQQACMKDHGKPKIIVCTNIAEASVTVPGVTVVIDEGLRRTIRTKGGVQGLYTERISNAECAQRAGRSGRVSPGIYVCHHPLTPEERPNYPEPEITRLQLDNMTLRLRAQGHDPRELGFLNRPSAEAFDDADERLQILGCLDGARKVTTLGRKLADVSLSVNLARMLHEAERVGVLKEAIELAAVVEAGGIVESGSRKWRELVRERCPSDAIAQLDVFRWAKNSLLLDSDREDRGIDLKALSEANEHVRELEFRFRDALKNQRGATNNGQKLLVQCLCAGFKTNAFVRRRDDWIDSRGGTKRELDSLSVISNEVSYIVGVPWDLNLTPNGITRHFVRWATAVSWNELPKRMQTLVRDLEHRDRDPHKVDARSPRFGFRR